MGWDEILRTVAGVDWQRVLNTLVTLAASIFALFKWGERQKALREQIRGDLELLTELEKNRILNDHTQAPAWLHGKILLDIAKLTRTPIGAKKRPIAWGSLLLAASIATGFSFWTYVINSNGFVWYSLVTGLVAVLFALSVLGLLTNRELPPDESLPPGAVPLQSEIASEQVVGAIAQLSMKTDDSRFGPNGVAGVALRVFQRLQAGEYESALADIDPLWLECRVRSWLWNNHLLGVFPAENLAPLLTSMKEGHRPLEVWNEFVTSEARQFAAAWSGFGQVGAGTTRRVMSRDTELVVIAPSGKSGGYYVQNATVIPNAITLLMRRGGDEWKLVNHGGTALPLAEWPPVWWMVNDPAIGTESPTLNLA